MHSITTIQANKIHSGHQQAHMTVICTSADIAADLQGPRMFETPTIAFRIHLAGV